MINSTIILGGGNAGLMSALYLKTSLNSLDISVIKSKKIGTIGVGEGSTEHWTRFASAVGITMVELIEHCGATIKTGIKFENWHGDGTSYFHSLPECLIYMDGYTGMPHTMMRLIGDGVDSQSLHWPLVLENNIVTEPLTDYYQFHFDSEKLNAYLQQLCIKKGITLIDAEIVDCILDNEGFVQSIVDDNNQQYSADFFIDSSGFKRVIASKLGATWVDWSKHLPLNSAIAFQTGEQDVIPVYTLAKAMNSGWHWRSPVQGRFGNGYVFSDQFITEEQAVDEIQTHFKDTITIGRKINFVSGKVNQAWIKNCVSIGLSSNFVEPLEASSISTTIQQIRLLVSGLDNWDRNDTGTIKAYNRVFDDTMFNVLDFIQLHYFTQREDTEFWRWCKHEITMTDFNKENLEMFKTNFVNQTILPEDGVMSNFRIYDCLNWIQVMHGLRMFDTTKIKALYEKRYSGLYRDWCENNIKQMTKITKDGWVDHKEAIASVKQQAKGLKIKL
jgi:tryptophan 7-halogenase